MFQQLLALKTLGELFSDYSNEQGTEPKVWALIGDKWVRIGPDFEKKCAQASIHTWRDIQSNHEKRTKMHIANLAPKKGDSKGEVRMKEVLLAAYAKSLRIGRKRISKLEREYSIKFEAPSLQGHA